MYYVQEHPNRQHNHPYPHHLKTNEEKKFSGVITSASPITLPTPSSFSIQPPQSPPPTLKNKRKMKKTKAINVSASSAAVAESLSMSLSHERGCCWQEDAESTTTQSTMVVMSVATVETTRESSKILKSDDAKADDSVRNVVDSSSSFNKTTDFDCGLHNGAAGRDGAALGSNCACCRRTDTLPSPQFTLATADRLSSINDSDDSCMVGSEDGFSSSEINIEKADRKERNVPDAEIAASISHENIRENDEKRKGCNGKVLQAESKSNFQVLLPPKSFLRGGLTSSSSLSRSSPSSFSKTSSLSIRSPTRLLFTLGLVLSWMSLSSSVVFAKIQQDHKEHSSDQVQALLGNIAELPCDLNAHIGEKIRLVLWSKNDTVIYSLDARDKALEEGQHWSNEQALGGRAYFRIATDPPSLVIENVKESDAGLYKCRLDFKNSPTVYHTVNMTVIIPPQKVVVVDERGLEYTSTSQLAPYSEGSSLRLTCISTGGWPVPKVSWWRENALLDDTWEVSSEHVTSTVVSNTLTIGRLQRSDLNARLTCQAANNNITIPVSTTVMLEMNFRPLEVKLVNKKLALSAEKEYTLECQSSGARPPAVMTWMRGSTKIKHHKESVSKDENVTTSVMTFIPTLDDSGKVLACRAENPKIPGSMIEDGWKMDIHFVPQVSLDFGSKINSTHIREGEDVYFECSIKANPWIQKVSWRHNGRILHHNTSAGIIISNQSLVLQSITRKSAGLYTCVGTNSEGDGASNPVVLNVKYAPVCKSHQQTVYGIARQEQAKILCDVDANPDTDLHFRWKFNNSAETIDIQQSHYQVERHRSTLTYKPMTELDYGTVLCWATHETIGTQKIPCVYHIIPAGKPDAVSNCSILNQTFDSLFVSCVEGFNGGLQQSFVIEIWDFHSQHVIRNLTNHRPVFNVRGLEPGESYIVRIYAVNSKGRSEVQVLQASTLKAAEKQTGYSAEASSVKPVFLNMTPILGILIAVVATLILVAVVIVLVMRGRGHNGEDKRIPKNNGGVKSSPEHDKSTVPLKKSVEELPDVDDKNPDVVPHSSEIDGIDPDEKVFLERLNNTSRFYETIPRAVRTASAATSRADPNSSAELVNNVKNRAPRTGREEVTYAELSLPNSPAYHSGTLRHQQHQQPNIRPQEPIIYAQIDPLKTAQCVPVGVHEQQTQTLPGYPLTLPPPHPVVAEQGEEFVHLRPENAHAVYSNPGTNMRF